MLKRQRPATPPPSSLGDAPSLLPDGLTRPLQPLNTTDLAHPRPKRLRTQPPPLDGTLRGWLESEPKVLRWESDDEEDWIEDTHVVSGSPLPPASQYKGANSLLHELHVLNQHRLLFAHPPPDRPLNPNPKIPLPAAHVNLQDPTSGHGPATPWADKPPAHSTLQFLPRDGFAGRSCVMSPDKGLGEEVQRVRQRYEGANRLLGSLFLSRRREVEGTISFPAPGCGR